MKEITNYLFETGMLKRVKRSGWWICKIKNPESVAEHSYRTAVVTFLLAKLENESDESAQKLATAAIFHDMHETRILDLHKIVARYIDGKEGAKNAQEDQIKNLPQLIQNSLKRVITKLNNKERMILKDADLLEMGLQAKEYIEIGYTDAEDWIKNVEKKLKTKSAKRLIKEIKRTDSNEWYRGLKKLK